VLPGRVNRRCVTEALGLGRPLNSLSGRTSAPNVPADRVAGPSRWQDGLGQLRRSGHPSTLPPPDERQGDASTITHVLSVRCGSHRGHGVAQLVQINQTDRAPAPADWLDTNRANPAGRGTRKRLERQLAQIGVPYEIVSSEDVMS
jgi:hypothetical protein